MSNVQGEREQAPCSFLGYWIFTGLDTGYCVRNLPPLIARVCLGGTLDTALCSRCGSVERAGRPRPRRSTRRGSSSEKWCRRGEIGKRGLSCVPTYRRTALPPFATGTHRIAPVVRCRRSPYTEGTCQVSVAFSLRQRSRKAHADRLRFQFPMSNPGNVQFPRGSRAGSLLLPWTLNIGRIGHWTLPSPCTLHPHPDAEASARRCATRRERRDSISNSHSHKYPIPKGSYGGLLVTSLGIGCWLDWILDIASANPPDSPPSPGTAPRG